MKSREALTLVLLVCLVSLAVLFHRTWLYGEVFSPADVVFSFYPWTYDAPLTPTTNSTRSDEAFFHQPLMETHWRRLKRPEWPDYEPDVLGGVPAFFQGLDVGRAFSPMSLPFYLAPADVAVTLYAPLRLLAAALCMWIYLRGLGLAAIPSAAGAVAFALNGAFITWLSAPMPTVALFLPLAWWCVDRALERGPEPAGGAVTGHDVPLRREVGWLALSLGALVLGAYVPTILACLFATGVYALARVAARRQWSALGGLALAGALGLAIGAVALVPMFDNLRTSPVSSRTMAQAYLPWANLVTFFAPKFWGSPVSSNWWYPGVGVYPELVTYLGISTVALAAAGAVHWFRVARDIRAPILGGLAALSLGMMYGWPPATWLTALPGFKQMSPLRWNVILAAVTAVFAAWGVQWTTKRATGWQPAAAAVVALGALATAAGATTYGQLATIRALSLQPFLRAELLAASVIALAMLALITVAWRRPRDAGGTAIGFVCTVLIGSDLVRAGLGFNPTLPPEKLYPTTPAIEFLQQKVPPNRFAPIGSGGELVNAHVWSVFGLSSITGLDFYGDDTYQRFLAAADGTPFTGAKWEYVGPRDPARANLKLLGLLTVDYLALSPRDVGTTVGGYLPLIDVTDGRTVRQSFECRHEGLRRVDVMTGTHERPNEGSVVVSLVDEETGETVARRETTAANVPSNSWLTIEFEPVTDSAGRRFAIEIRGEGAGEGRATMVWGAIATGNPVPAASVDGEETDRVLWFRAFSAPQSVGDAPLVYARDLNIYRNPHSRPRAWFARDVVVAPRGEHIDRLLDPAFDSVDTVLVTAPTPPRPSPRARVTSMDLSGDDTRRISVDAPDGGVLVIADRWHRGWRAMVDGIATPIDVADAVLMSVAVPPGGRDVRLEFVHPLVRPSMLTSALATLLALALTAVRRTPTKS